MMETAVGMVLMAGSLFTTGGFIGDVDGNFEGITWQDLACIFLFLCLCGVTQ